MWAYFTLVSPGPHGRLCSPPQTQGTHFLCPPNTVRQVHAGDPWPSPRVESGAITLTLYPRQEKPGRHAQKQQRVNAGWRRLGQMLGRNRQDLKSVLPLRHQRNLESWQIWPFQPLPMMTEVGRVRLNFLTCLSLPDWGLFSLKPQVPARHHWRVRMGMCVCEHMCASRCTHLPMGTTHMTNLQAKASCNLLTKGAKMQQRLPKTHLHLVIIWNGIKKSASNMRNTFVQ